MSFLEVASRNNGVKQSSVEFPFFVAVLYRGKMIEKKVYTSKFDFAAGEKRKGVFESFNTTLYFSKASLSAREQERERSRRRRRDRDRNQISDEEGPRIDTQLANYQVLVGFQLSKPELQYNVFH